MKTFWCATCERLVNEVVASNFHQGHCLFEHLSEEQQEELREAQDEADVDDPARALLYDTVGTQLACPKCGEARVDYLIWNAEVTAVTCTTCGTVYDPAKELGPDETTDRKED